MAVNDALKRYIEAGLAFTAMTQARAEALVKDLVKAGEVQADQARDAVAELLERSRDNRESLLDTVRAEVRAQITNLGLASHADLDRIEHRMSSLLGRSSPSASRSATHPRPADASSMSGKQASGPAAPGKRAAGRKTSATKTAGKKTSATKTAGKKTSATKTAGKKTSATKTAGKKTAGKKTAGTRPPLQATVRKAATEAVGDRDAP